MFVENNIAILITAVCTITLLSRFPSNHAFDLTILHNNDMHAHFEQIDNSLDTCSSKDPSANECFGGFARVSSLVKQYRYNAKNGSSAVLYLNAGDSYAGTPWYTIFRHKVVTEFMNILKPDAMVSVFFLMQSVGRIN